jgi:drug/metabolite transporter superfamily protein YnfA
MKLNNAVQISVMVGAALLEVGGDALIRRGMRGGGSTIAAVGFVLLGSYGVLLTWLEVDFGRLLGGYVGLFALMSILFGLLAFRERVSTQTWVGLAVVLVGSLIIQFGSGPS